MNESDKIAELEAHLRILENQFTQLCLLTEGLQKKVMEQEQTNQVLIRSNQQLIEWIDDTLRDMQSYENNAPYEILDRQQEAVFWYPKIASVQETAEQILKQHKSLSRFGDGEFAAIQGISRHHFHTVMNPALAARLAEILQSEDERILVAIANNYGSLEQYTRQARREIRSYMTAETRKQHYKLLRLEKQYYDAYLTRPYMMYADKQTDKAAERFSHLREIWDKRECIIVEGDKTRLGIGNDLFSNAASIRRIICPAENAFESYDAIMEACMAQNEDALYLIALGPTATVLAYDLAVLNRQALDIGHLDLEYEWYIRGLEHREVIPGKYTNECQGGDVVEAFDSREYREEIIERIEGC